MSYDPENDHDVIRIRNDLTLDHEQKIDAIIDLIRSRSKLAPTSWMLDIWLDDELLNDQKLAFRTKAGAIAALAQYVREMWSDPEIWEADDPTYPSGNMTDDQIIQAFFATHGDYRYLIEERFPPVPPPDPGDPLEPADMGFHMAMTRPDGRGGQTFVSWETEASRKLIARAFLD